MAKARISAEFERAIRALERHGIRYKVLEGEVYIDGRDWRKYNRLCDEGKLPRALC